MESEFEHQQRSFGARAGIDASGHGVHVGVDGGHGFGDLGPEQLALTKSE